MDIEILNGVGSKTKSILEKLGIYTVNDLLEYYPYKYSRIIFSNIINVDEQESIYVEGVVTSTPIVRRIRKNMNILTFKALVDNKEIKVSIFNRGFLKNNISIGKSITLYGKYNIKTNTFNVSDIKLNKLKNGTIIPSYHLTNGIKEGTLKKYIYEAFSLNKEIINYIPEYLENKYNFINKKDALIKIHYPKTLEDIKQAKLRLIYEELFVFMFKINYLKYCNREIKENIREGDISEIDDFIRTLPFELTIDQLEAIKQIYNDMTSNHRMSRLVQGDVGSGKTIVAVIAALINYKSGKMSAMMVPTEILVLQHYENIKNILQNTDIKVAYLIGSMKAKEKAKIQEELKNGEIDFIIGTHALISKNTNFKNLGLVITDEQHRFGVNQRSELHNKGEDVDILYLSATPIPRTFALTIYGDMDITSIKTKPSGRKEVKTLIYNDKEIKKVLSLMVEEIKKGRQIFVVSPLIEENEENNLLSVNKLKEKFDLAFNNKINISILHGKLKSNEKDKIMNDFLEKKSQILISTTVIEVGVDIKNATMIVIFNAERFGLSTLHQLRGRIGRNNYDCTCILIGDNNNKRLKVLEESSDGFYITEKDYELRGEGDLFGNKQSGEVTFKLANLKNDFKILLKVKEDSEKFLLENIDSDFKNYPYYCKIVNEMKNLN